MELTNQSENGDKLSQIKLFFKQYYDFDDIKAAMMTCDKWRKNNLFLEGIWIYYGFCHCYPHHTCFEYPENKAESSLIFQQFIDDKKNKDTDDEILGYACNMMALCRNKYDPWYIKNFMFAAERGITYGHNNSIRDLTNVELKMHYYKLSASKYNKWALLNLAKIYLDDDQHRNPPPLAALAIECYQTAMNCGYDLGCIYTIVKLQKYDIDITGRLLEQIYLTDDQHRNLLLAIGCYQKTMNGRCDISCIDTILQLQKYDTNITIQLLEYEISRKKCVALHTLAQIYLSRQLPNLSLAIKCYQNLMDGGYDLGDINKVLKLEKYDMNITYTAAGIRDKQGK